MTVLYLEDEVTIGQIVRESLTSRGHRIEWFPSGAEAAEALAAADRYDVAVLDVQLPGEDGFRIAKKLRDQHPNLPIIFLTARTQAKDVVTGFSAGGDDYLRKPFSMEELLVRMENLIRLRTETGKRSGEDTLECYRIGRTTFDYREMQLRGDAGEQTLSHREAELLRYLIRHRADRQIDRRQLLRDLWGDDGFFHGRNLDVYVRKLRGYLAEEPAFKLITLRGVGYRLVLENGTTEG